MNEKKIEFLTSKKCCVVKYLRWTLYPQKRLKFEQKICERIVKIGNFFGVIFVSFGTLFLLGSVFKKVQIQKHILKFMVVEFYRKTSIILV